MRQPRQTPHVCMCRVAWARASKARSLSLALTLHLVLNCCLMSSRVMCPDFVVEIMNRRATTQGAPS
jgi:hypothetical protein